MVEPPEVLVPDVPPLAPPEEDPPVPELDPPGASMDPPHAETETPTSAPLAASEARKRRRRWFESMVARKQLPCAR